MTSANENSSGKPITSTNATIESENNSNNGVYESSKSHDLPIVEPSCCESISKSWTSLASIYTDSFSIIDVISRSSEYLPFSKSLKWLFIIRIISLFVVIGLEAGVSYRKAFKNVLLIRKQFF